MLGMKLKSPLNHATRSSSVFWEFLLGSIQAVPRLATLKHPECWVYRDAIPYATDRLLPKCVHAHRFTHRFATHAHLPTRSRPEVLLNQLSYLPSSINLSQGWIFVYKLLTLKLPWNNRNSFIKSVNTNTNTFLEGHVLRVWLLKGCDRNTHILIHVLRYHSKTYYFVNYYANKFLKHLESIQLLNIDIYGVVFLFWQ